MTSPQEIEWLDPLVRRRFTPEIRRLSKHVGMRVPPPQFYYLADCPWMVRADIDLDILGHVYVYDQLADLIYLVVSQDNSCRFCYSSSRMLMRMSGMSESQIEAVEQSLDGADTDPKLKRALDFARRISRSNPLPGAADRKPLLDVGYSELAVRELAFQASEVVFHNRMGTLLALPPRLAERVTRSRFAGLFRPLFDFAFKGFFDRAHKKGETEALGEEHKSGPYTNVVLALDGLPAARVLRKLLDDAWASPHLPPRTKALIFAVIARGLGSLHSEREAYGLLTAEGLPSEDVDEILAHLMSPALDPVEAQILPYVRETIWCRPATVQRRGRELLQNLTNAQFLETVGIAALANMVCRLASVLDEP